MRKWFNNNTLKRTKNKQFNINTLTCLKDYC